MNEGEGKNLAYREAAGVSFLGKDNFPDALRIPQVVRVRDEEIGADGEGRTVIAVIFNLPNGGGGGR